jgi:glycosyltransferase involved in cell wall biosynthesis
VLWVSTLRRWKRPELFVELARRLPGVRFRMVGGPSAEIGGQDLFDRVKQSAAGLSNLEFVGFVPFAEIDQHFNAARIFVNTSEYEGFPNTFLQAWSRAIPTVSFFDTGSVVEGERVVTLATDLDNMADQVRSLVQHDDSWSRAGRRGRACYEAFHTPDIALEIYERLFERQWRALEQDRLKTRWAA